MNFESIVSLPAAHWHGSTWRAHRRRYAPDNPGGSVKVSGRYHRGLDRFPPDQIWPSLYLSLAPEVCLGELLRHVSPELLPQLNDYQISELFLNLEAVLDCRDPALLGVSLDALLHDTDFTAGQELGAAAVARAAEGMLVPSATRLGDNLILFPAQLRSPSQIQVLSSRHPRLYVARG